EVGKGSGLGLAQVFGFAKQSGGGASIETELGIGTTVNVFLPCAAAQPAELDEEDGIDLQPVLGARHSILLVDDDHSVREVTSQMLEKLGFAVIEADSGEMALQVLESSADVDLLLA